MSETSLIFLSLIYFEIFQNKTSRQKDRRGGETRVRVEDKRKSRLLKFSDVVSVNLLLVTTLVQSRPRGELSTSGLATSANLDGGELFL